MTDAELSQVRSELAEIYTPDGIEIWLFAHHKLLGGRKAINCTAEEVLRVVEQLTSGAVL